MKNKAKIPYGTIISTDDLRELPDGILFSEHFMDGLAMEPPIFKKLESIEPSGMWPDGDVLIEEMVLTQYAETPGEACRLGIGNDQEKMWLIWTPNNTQQMVWGVDG